jgi:hypothetical protein
VAPVVGLVGTRASWRRTQTERWHRSARQGLVADGGIKRCCSLCSYRQPQTSGGETAALAALASVNGDLSVGEEERGEWRAGAGGSQRKSDGRRRELTARDSMKNGATWDRLSLTSGRQSTVAGDREARRSRSRGARAMAWAAALRSDSGRGSFGQPPLGPGYNCAGWKQGTPPTTASQGMARSSLENDMRAPCGRFPRFKNKPLNCFPCDKNRYNVRKNPGNFVKVENEIWNTFHN